MTHPYKDAVQALEQIVRARMTVENREGGAVTGTRSATGAQIERLKRDAINPDPDGNTDMKRAVQTRSGKPIIPREYIVMGELGDAWDAMGEYDQLILRLYVIIPDWLNTARRCLRATCKHIRLAGWEEGHGLVWDAACPLCGHTRSAPIKSKAVMAVGALNKYRRDKFRRAKDGYRDGTMPFGQFMRAVHQFKKDEKPGAWGGIARGALDRWEKELKRRQLVA